MSRHLVAWTVCLLLLSDDRSAEAHPPLFPTGTIREQESSSSFIVFGRLENRRPEHAVGYTELVITEIVKNDPILKNRKVFRTPYDIPVPDPKTPLHCIAFGTVIDGGPHLHYGVVGTSAVLDYVKGSLAIDDAKDRTKLIRYCFDYLQHADEEIARDAFCEFSKSSDEDLRTVGRTLPAAKLRRWLQDARIEERNLSLYAILLGHCGKPDDAALLWKLLDKFVATDSREPFVDGFFIGHTLLKPGDGWGYMRDIVKNPKASFGIRYDGLRTARYFQIVHPGLIAQKDMLNVMGLLIDQNDMADLPIEYLRQWKRWELTERILALFDKKEFDHAIIRRSIVHYAL